MDRRIRTKFIQYDSNGNLYCYKCGKYKPESDFDVNNDKSNWFRNYKDRRCKECKKLQILKRKQANRGKKIQIDCFQKDGMVLQIDQKEEDGIVILLQTF